MATSVIALTLSGGTAAALPEDMTSTAPHAADSSPMTCLEDRYELGAFLGAGAMGEVYAAYDKVLGIDVAVKIMRREHVGSATRIARFTHEARVSTRMMSPHIVKVYGIAVTRDGLPCIVLELLEGETLATRIGRDGTLSVALTTDIVKQLARALARVHALGIVHRDVKPENVFLTRDAGGRMLVKLIDFGIAEQLSPAGHQLVGTPEYMAPEVVFGTHDLDVRSDLYALGVVAFECLTGRCPIVGSVDQVFMMLRHGERASLLQLRPDLSGAIGMWMDCALRADPMWRFASAKEMSESLEHATTVRRPAIVAFYAAA
ncbi:MAG: Adenylate cyclase [Labilithrix sp.]|nr:Adenylate cyclase [Labilithrix sp.]